MMTALPAPPIPADIDMRDYRYMPLEVVRLRDSTLAVKVSAEAFRAAVLLWCASWHQMPAGSLPDDDRVLARLAGIDNIRTWKRVREEALHGFQKCSDSRLYHHLICERAANNWDLKGKRSRGGKNSGETRRKQSLEKQQNHHEESSQKDVRANEQWKGIEKGIGKESSVTNVTGAAAPDDIKKRLFGPCLDWLGKQTGKPPDKYKPLVGRWIRDHGDGVVLEVFIACGREKPLEAIPWIEKALTARAKRSSDRAARDRPMSVGSIEDAMNYQEDRR